MEEFLKTAEEYRQKISRRKELEQYLSDAEQQLQDLRASLPERKLTLAQAEWDRQKAENPGFLQRLLRGQEELREKAESDCRSAKAELERTNREIADLVCRMEAAKREDMELSDSKAAYIVFLEEHLTVHPEAQAMLYRQYALDAVEVSLNMTNVLQGTRPGMVHDVYSDRVMPGDGRMAILAQADAYAVEFCALVEKLPEGTVALGTSLRRPSAYINAVTMEYAQLDRLNNVLDHARDARKKLREYFGIS